MSDIALPIAVSDRSKVPAEIQPHYSATKNWRTDSHPLEWVSADDQASVMAYHLEIKSGQVKMLPAGETPETIAAKEKENAAAQSAFAAELDRLTEEDKARRIAKYEAAETKRRKQFESSLNRPR